ncbi:hypothetical protein HK102_002084, partial [Quaeritorhiza haematococci]
MLITTFLATIAVVTSAPGVSAHLIKRQNRQTQNQNPWKLAFATHFGPHDGTDMNKLVCGFRNINFPFAAVSDTSVDLWVGDKCGVRQGFQPPPNSACRRQGAQQSLPDGSGFLGPECPAAKEAGGVCGRCLEVRCKSSFEGDPSVCNLGVTQKVRIVDVCPEIHPNNICKRRSPDKNFADPRRNCGNFGGNSVDLDRDVMNRLLKNKNADALGNIQIQFRR